MIKRILALTAISLLLGNTAFAAKLYKWVDKDGNVHYTNHPPPEAAKEERQVLDERGIAVETLARQKTQEEIAAEEKAAREQRAAQLERERLQRESDMRDRMLITSYARVADMEEARDGRSAAIEAQINVASGVIGSLEARVVDLENRVKRIRDSGRTVPEATQAQLDEARKELLDNQKFLLARREEQELIRRQFADDIARFKELSGKE